ncbi:acyl carrier protein [Pseudomonas putida]|uniref:acyl carrier protein n=1 Tax=Pseudomonas putida TaxID=303 RepID=UPI00236537E2|nr:acyl carrier protein [Pseudomonas putida]MDD2047569.1 acyl carrier protein [Pseudomonas putida]
MSRAAKIATGSIILVAFGTAFLAQSVVNRRQASEDEYIAKIENDLSIVYGAYSRIVRDGVKRALSESLQIPVDSIKDVDTLNSLGADSLDTVSFALDLNKYFRVEIEDVVCDNITEYSVSYIAEFLIKEYLLKDVRFVGSQQSTPFSLQKSDD